MCLKSASASSHPYQHVNKMKLSGCTTLHTTYCPVLRRYVQNFNDTYQFFFVTKEFWVVTKGAKDVTFLYELLGPIFACKSIYG